MKGRAQARLDTLLDPDQERIPMGRETRQARRQRQRRQQQRQQLGTSRWAVLAGTGVIVAVIIVFVALVVRGNPASGANGPSSTASNVGPPIDGIQCNGSMETAAYHHHAHLQFYVKGNYIIPPPYVGEDIYHDCLYWTHIHDPSYGVIHIEAPHAVTPTLKNFFDVWHQPLSRTRAWRYSTKLGESMRVYLKQKLYTGDPGKIRLVQHQEITIEFGPPFVKPAPFDFAAHQL